MLMEILRLYSTLLNNDIRLVKKMMNLDKKTELKISLKVIVRGLILMRNRGLIDCLQLSQLFFHRLLQCQDRLLRVTIQTHLINDIKRQNEKHKNHKLNSVRTFLLSFRFKFDCFSLKSLQNFFSTIIKETNPTAIKMALVCFTVQSEEKRN